MSLRFSFLRRAAWCLVGGLNFSIDPRRFPAMSPVWPAVHLLSSVVVLLMIACPLIPPVDTFNDHTQDKIASLADFEKIAVAGPSSTATKFVITSFLDDNARKIFWFDSHFYTLHDQWYWFRLMNGATIPGLDDVPFAGGPFATVDEIVAWAKEQEALPLDLRFVGDRLYSPRFYTLTLSTEPRPMAAGTLVHFPARVVSGINLPETWGLELEYQDLVTEEDLGILFSTLDSSLPSSIATQVKWIVRSPFQEELAQELESKNSPLAAKLIRSSELTVAGAAEVYSEGLTAGRLRIVKRGENILAGSQNNDILVVEELPAFLPPCQGIISADAQTPLAHINILAKNRGIPNAYQEGILDDPHIEQLASVRAPVVLRAVAPNQLIVEAMTEDEFAHYRTLTAPIPASAQLADVTNIPYVLDLRTVTYDAVDALRPMIGGKNSGFLALLSTEDISLPDVPVAVTVRAYAEHISRFSAQIDAMLLDDTFRRSPRARYLALEGPAGFISQFSTDDDKQFANEVLARPTGDILGDLAKAGGLRRMIATAEIPAATLAAVEAGLQEHFIHLDHKQALRFRSSSTIEDIEGFNGAGLYASYTGYLYPEEQEGGAQQRTLAKALRDTWASYWGAEAFEERQLARVEHRSGRMAIAVHPRFDDESELDNGVYTFTLMPPHNDVEYAVLEINIQKGTLSVTNPPVGSTALPEIIRVALHRADVQFVEGELAYEQNPAAAIAYNPQALHIERVQASTESPNQTLLSDEDLAALFAQTLRVSHVWITEENRNLLRSQFKRSVVLDLEMRTSAAGWPAYADGSVLPERIVIKQVRSLEPGLERADENLRSLPIPRDILARARRVEQHKCTGTDTDVFAVDVYTDRAKAPDVGYNSTPFLSFVTLSLKNDVPSLGLSGSTRKTAVYTAMSSYQIFIHTEDTTQEFSAIDAHINAAQQNNVGVSRLFLGAQSDLPADFAPDSPIAPSSTGERIALLGPNPVSENNATPQALFTEEAICETTLLLSSPEEYLLSLLPASDSQ